MNYDKKVGVSICEKYIEMNLYMIVLSMLKLWYVGNYKGGV